MRKSSLESRQFTTTQVGELLGIATYKVISYIDRGFVKPSIQDAEGHGSRRLWSYEDLIVCAAIVIADKMISVKGIRYIAKLLGDRRHVKERQVLTIPLHLTASENFGEFWAASGGAFSPEEEAAIKADYEAYRRIGVPYARTDQSQLEAAEILEPYEIKISMRRVRESVANRIESLGL